MSDNSRDKVLTLHLAYPNLSESARANKPSKLELSKLDLEFMLLRYMPGLLDVRVTGVEVSIEEQARVSLAEEQKKVVCKEMLMEIANEILDKISKLR